MRDSQRQKLYNAENIAEKKVPFHAGFKSREEIDAYVARITRSAWWRKHYSRGDSIVVRHVDRFYGKASAGWRRITIPAWAWKTRSWDNTKKILVEKNSTQAAWIILHELAHCIVQANTYALEMDARKRGVPWVGIAGHGREFARAFLDIIRRFGGREAWQALKEQYKASGVKVRKYVKRPDLVGRMPPWKASAAKAATVPVPEPMPNLGEEQIDGWIARMFP